MAGASPAMTGEGKDGTADAHDTIPPSPSTPHPRCVLPRCRSRAHPALGLDNLTHSGRHRPLTMPPRLYGREVLAHVQGESPKANAAVLARLSSSPATSALLVAASLEGVAAMHQPYSLWADWLSKFQSSSEPIQALWLLAVPATLLGLVWLALWAVRDLIGLARRERYWRGHVVYGVYQDCEGLWMVYWHCRKLQEIDWANPPPELIGRGTVVQGVFRRPEE
jgi:hypothetical protein